MRKELKIKGDCVEWVSPRIGKLIGRLLNQGHETVRMVVAGCAGVIYSSLTLKELEWIRKNHPDMLRITDDDGNSFELCFGEECPGIVTDRKVDFGNHVSPDGYLEMTVLISPDIEDSLGAVIEMLGKKLIRLSELEKHLLPLLRRSADKGRCVRSRIIWI